ncbi:MAG: hypothetical protein BWY02_02390 [bacterium ADurb.Bin157]|nr:MAG: hypothetical protein BWY02_02390 [bacterium ADurb.Bin157]
MCFITSNKWMRAGYGEKTRNFFATKTNPIQLIDFAGIKIFESATVDTNILLFQKAANQKRTKACVTKGADCRNNLSDYVRQSSSICVFDTSDSWVVLSPIEQSIKRKIEQVGTPLKDWDINIYRGILTGCNEAFIISGEKKNEILANCITEEERTKTAELIRPILRGRDIKRYGYEFADLWLINTHNGVKDKGIKPININDYPAVKAHLDSYWDKIEPRADQGDTPYNLRNCAYMEDFSRQKIVFQEIVQESQFMLDNTEYFYCNDTCRIIVGNSIEFLLGIMNSNLFFYAIKRFYSGGSLGEAGIRMKHTFFQDFPCIPENDVIKKLSNQLSEQYNTKKELKINRKIYELYGLSDEEISFIENSI